MATLGEAAENRNWQCDDDSQCDIARGKKVSPKVVWIFTSKFQAVAQKMANNFKGYFFASDYRWMLVVFIDMGFI